MNHHNRRQAVILAGGKGTRLLGVSGGLPKPMTPVLGKPLLQHLIEQCVKNSIFDIRLLIAYRGDVIKDYFNDGSKFGVNIQYYEESEPRGTAGALLDVLEYLNDHFLVIYGDTFFDVDLDELWGFHLNKNADATLFLHPNDHPYDSDLIDINKELMVTKVYPYPHSSHQWHRNLVNAALYMMRKSALAGVALPSNKPDIAKDLFPRMIELDKRLFGYVSTEYIKDMGTPQRLHRLEQDIDSGKVTRLSNKNYKSALFLDRDGVINYEVNHLSSPEQLNLLPGVGVAIRKANQAGLLVVVITNQAVIARGELSNKNLRIIHNKLETLLGREGAYVDALYYCPHHPESGFDGEVPELKIKCDCRKPSTGLLLRAAEQLNISLKDSWMVGDTTSDILMAKRAGVRNILVKTGHAGRDKKHPVTADYILEDLKEAVKLVLSERYASDIYINKLAGSKE